MNNFDYKEIYNAVDISREFLLRLVPKKPMSGLIEILAPSFYGCGNCGKAMMRKDFDGKRFNFCPYCGQAIDWSEAN